MERSLGDTDPVGNVEEDVNAGTASTRFAVNCSISFGPPVVCFSGPVDYGFGSPSRIYTRVLG